MEQRATAEPREVGLEPVRLERIDTAFHAEVEEGRVPGAVVLIARHGKIAYLKSFGFQDREKRIPMKTDAIFRIASLTKPIISTAALMLAEEGKLRITAPVSQYLPEFTNLKVRVERPSASGGRPELVLEPQRGEMTIYDLLRHTSGLGHFLIGASLVNEAYRAADVAAPNQTLSELMTKLSRLPLAFHPGTTFEYGLSTDVLGRVIEVITQMDLDQFIAKPLVLLSPWFTSRALGELAARALQTSRARIGEELTFLCAILGFGLAIGLATLATKADTAWLTPRLQVFDGDDVGEWEKSLPEIKARWLCGHRRCLMDVCYKLDMRFGRTSGQSGPFASLIALVEAPNVPEHLAAPFEKIYSYPFRQVCVMGD